MYRAVLFFLILFPASILMSLQKEDYGQLISEAPAPAWTKDCGFSLDPIPLKPSQVNLQYLLTDIQRNFVEQSIYYHYVLKPVSQNGVRHVAQVDIDFSPSYESVVVHGIRVFRDGAWSDRLQDARLSVLQRESDLERDLYQGVVTLVYFLEDICEEDILEYSFSIQGDISYFSTHLTNLFHLQGGVVFERLHRRMLFSPDTEFDYKLFNCQVLPEISDFSDSLRELSWELTETSPVPHEEGTPAWYHPISYAQFSQYGSWKEVIAKLLPIYLLPEDFDSNPSMEMVAAAENWMRATLDPREHALLALRFVQEKVRYLGFEEGISGFMPADPRVVFQRRFGDCKDKTFLLHALLRLMDIDSTPVLVHSSNGENLPDSLPMPFVFDHIVLRIEIDGLEYWVDPTLYRQGGNLLQDNFFPCYYWGLPLSKSGTGLVSLPANEDQIPSEIETSFRLTSQESAQLKVVRTFYGENADYLRIYLDQTGVQNFSDDFRDFLQKMYGSASVVSKLTIADDRDNNALAITQTFQVPTQKRAGKRVLKVFSLTVGFYLDNELNPERSSPYALEYPNWVKEHIRVENPYVEWASASEQHEYQHESLFYSRSSTQEGQVYDCYYELKNLNDHVPVDSIRNYWEIASDIEQDGLFIVNVLPDKQKAA
jgi:hypothetical protein